MFLLHCISLITVTSSAHLLSNLRHFFSNCFKNKMPCVPMQLSRMSSVVASGSHFIFLTSDTSCEINIAPRWALLVCQQSSHQSFSNAKCGNPVSLTACVCLLSCSVPLSLFGFFFCFGFPAPFPFRRRSGGSLDCRTAQSTDVEIVRKFSAERRWNSIKLRGGCFDESTGWGS